MSLPGALPQPARQRRFVLLIGLAVSAWLVFIPTRSLVAEKLRIASVETRLDEVRRENDALRARVKRMNDPREVELQARDRLGWARPGERAYLVLPAPLASAPPPPRSPSAWSRFSSWLVRLVRGGG